MKVTVIGGGFVGVTTAVVFAEWGHEVHLVEISSERRQALQEARLPFYEEGLEPALQTAVESGRLMVASSLQEAPESDAVFLCVGTPSLPDGGADLSQLQQATRDVVAWGKTRLVVVKSTVPPGTTEKVVGPIVADAAGKMSVAMNPEFLREGVALKDAREPDRVVLGVLDEAGEKVLKGLYAKLSCPMLVTQPSTAELIKYASNSMLATRIAFSNEIANLAEQVGVHVDDVMEGVGLDHRIGPHFLRAGAGFGGSCFPKDVKALRAAGLQHGVRLGILDAVLQQNEEQPLVVVQRVDELVGGLEGKRVALLGLAFKSGTSDVRETRALPIHEGLRGAGAEVVSYDPKAGKEFLQLVPDASLVASVEEALDGADACVIQTEWPEFRDIPAQVFKDKMRRALVYDARRHLDANALREAGVEVYALGDGAHSVEGAT
jgi:UDPglucose 6-dehydrogenase